MMSETQLLESNVLRSLRQTSEARGLKFYVNPPREIVPEFLGDFQPDALALGPGGGIVIEVKSRNHPTSEKQLAAIAKRVANQKGWEFRAIYLNPPIDETPPIANPTPEQLQARFAEIEALTQAGHSNAAFVTAWTVLESLARLAVAGAKTGHPRGFSPIQAIQTLAQEGYIERETAGRLREMARLRNAVVHGDFSVEVEHEQIRVLLTQLRSLATDVMSVMSDQSSAG